MVLSGKTLILSGKTLVLSGKIMIFVRNQDTLFWNQDNTVQKTGRFGVENQFSSPRKYVEQHIKIKSLPCATDFSCAHPFVCFGKCVPLHRLKKITITQYLNNATK